MLGAYQVSRSGDFANWATDEMAGGGVGGAMDLAVGARSVVITMEHLDSAGRHKLVESCSYPLTAPGRADFVVTDLALFRKVDGTLRLDEVARGFDVEEVLSLSGMRPALAAQIGVMQDAFAP